MYNFFKKIKALEENINDLKNTFLSMTKTKQNKSQKRQRKGLINLTTKNC